MSSEVKSCYIYSDDDKRPPILLSDETPVIIGRGLATLITDTQCSRNQVRLYASYANRTVFVQQIGKRSCGLNGFETKRDVKLVARHGDCLEILYGCYRYRIEFNPPPSPLSMLGGGLCDEQERCSVFGSDKDFDCGKDRDDGDKERHHRDTRNSGTKRIKDEEPDECSGDIDDNTEDSGVQVISKRPKLECDVTEESTRRRGRSAGKASSVEAMNERGKKNMDSDGANTVKGENEDVNCMEKTSGEKASNKESWEEFGTLMVYTSAGVEGRAKIAAYDMDNTLIKTQSGLVFPKDQNDWQLLYPEVPGKLKKLHADGYKIVILTNQGGMFLGKVKPSDFKLKIERVVKKLGVPIQAFIATGRDLYRKPRTGMWDKLVNDKNDDVSVNMVDSFFVGDAAGRSKDWAPKKKKDHSSADRLLSMNLALTFYTPEEHFLGHKPAPYALPEFNPKKLPKSLPLYEPSNTALTAEKQEVILMVGGPGTGKSHIAKTHLESYHHINRDTLGSWQKCVTALENALSKGKSVVVDNTNPDVPSRQRYINVARSRGVPIRCFVMMTDKEHARHNNKVEFEFGEFRELTDPDHMTVTDIVINSYSDTNSTLLWRCTRFLKLLFLLCFRLFSGTLFNHVQPYRKNYVPPKQDEGFTEIVRINCIPRFTNKEHQKLYEMYLLEK